jgi:drug/metabolite transporter (DMT)-like permease
MAFESAGKKVGSLSVNLIRLIIAFFFIGFYSWVVRGFFFPSDATLFQWEWLALSGLVGFVIGDLLLFQALVVIGARISMLVMALAPPFAALIGWLVLGEVLSPSNLLGMAITLTGIVIVILKREKSEENGAMVRKIKSNYSVQGILLALGGAMGQGAGLVLSKKGMGDYDAFSASQIRVLTGIVGFVFILTFKKRWPRFRAAIQNRPAMKRITSAHFLAISWRFLFAAGRSAHAGRYCRNPDVDYSCADYFPFGYSLQGKNQLERNCWSNHTVSGVGFSSSGFF